jgi:hypothetical protein
LLRGFCVVVAYWALASGSGFLGGCMVVLKKKSIAGFTDKRKKSQLAPHGKLIWKLHQQGCTLGGIAHILFDKFALKVVPSTILRFIARLEQERSKPRRPRSRKVKPTPAMSQEQENPIADEAMLPSPAIPLAKRASQVSDEDRQRIEAFKHQKPQPEAKVKLFDHDPNQPLHLVSEDENK